MANDDDIETCDTCGLDVEGPHPHQVSAAYVNAEGTKPQD